MISNAAWRVLQDRQERAMGKESLLNLLVHPSEAKQGDFVFAHASNSFPYVDIFQIAEVTRNGYLRLEGRHWYNRRRDLYPPTPYRKEQYLYGLSLLRCPIVKSFVPSKDFPKYTAGGVSASRVLGRPQLVIADIDAGYTDGGYINVYFNLPNEGTSTVLLEEYAWEDNDKRTSSETPFAYMNNTRLKVFQIEFPNREKVFPGHFVNCRVAIGGRAKHGELRLHLLSRCFGGAIGTYTTILVDPC